MAEAVEPDPALDDAEAWAEMAQRLELFAWRRVRRRGGTQEHAYELTFEALARYFDPKCSSGDPNKPLLQRLGSIVNGLVQNRFRKGEVVAEVAVDPIKAVYMATKASDDQARVTSADAADVQEAMDLLLERVGEDREAEEIFFLEVGGLCRARDQAEKLGWKIGWVYEARRRLGSYRDEVYQRLEREAANV